MRGRRDRTRPQSPGDYRCGDPWTVAEEKVAVRYVHHPCGADPGLGPTCQNCGAVLRREELTATLDESYAAERDKRWADFKPR